MQIEETERHRCFGGHWHRYRHESAVLACSMHFSVYLPEKPQRVLLWLSGLTCTDQNFVQKAHAEEVANALGMAILVPDTSPRGAEIEGEDEDWDFGSGAAFWLDATQAPWSAHYRMETYLLEEFLPACMHELDLPPGPLALAGHSMGGHGALVLGLRHPQRFRTISAFSPICNPMQVPWGIRAFTGYLGDDRAAWRRHDACALIQDGYRASHLLVDQGEKDPFLRQQLHPEALERACTSQGIPLTLHRRAGYDHSYHFISTFIGEHLQFHARATD